MLIKEEPTGSEQKRLVITLAWDEVAADVPGFRPGKTPMAMIVTRFADDIMQAFVDRCAERFVREAILEEGVHPVGSITTAVVNLTKGKPVEVRCTFLEEPEFELPDCSAFSSDSEDDEQQRDELSDWLLEQVEMTLPDALVEEEMLFGDQPDEDDVKATELWREDAAQRVKLMLTLKRIAREEGIEVIEADVDERIAEMALEFGMRSVEVRQELVQGGGLSRLCDMLLAEQVLEFVLD